MKKNLFSLLAFGALTFGLASCSNDEPVPGMGSDGQQGERIGYLALTITNSQDSRSRADQEIVGDGTAGKDVTIDKEIFNDGDEYEYALSPNIQSNVVMFFDKDGNFFGCSNLTPFAYNDDNGHGATHTGTQAGYPEQFYVEITRWNNQTPGNFNSAADKPSQVMVLLNMNPDCINDLVAKAEGGLAQLVTAMGANNDTHSPYGIYTLDGKQYFSMSNSVYVDGGKVVTSAEITDDMICATPEEALQHRLTVYVERMLAKFQVTFNNQVLKTGDNVFFDPFDVEEGESTPAMVNYVAEYTGNELNLDYPEYEQIPWNVYVVNWGVNGVEPQSYIYKQITTADPFGANNANEGWNNASLHRSYWGLSPQYAETGVDKFPTQYRNASLDPNYAGFQKFFWGTDAASSTAHQTDGETALTYYSFDYYKTRAMYRYAPERTYSKEAATMDRGYSGYTPYRFASHILIGAQLILEGVDTDLTTKEGNELKNVAPKYFAYNYFWKDEASYIRYAYRRMITQFADGRAHSVSVNGNLSQLEWIADGSTFYKEDGTAIAVSEADKYFTTAPAQVVHGDGKRVLAAKEKIYYKNNEGELKEIPAADLTAVLYNYTDAVRHYNGGKMYYAIPVQHMFGLSGGLADNKKVTVNRDETVYATGQFGVVRNHWYKFNVQSIGSIGIPVDEPGQPIIPDPEDTYSIALEIVVLPWHVIDNGSVDL